jgi:hypothetical protein
MARNEEEAARMKQSLWDMQELYDEVAADYFIPKRFRKAPFTKFIKNNYLYYLKKEIENLKYRVEHPK